jgi:sensor histidine kinase YesM
MRSVFLLFNLIFSVSLYAQFQFAESFEVGNQMETYPLSIDFERIELPIKNTNTIFNIYEDSKGYIWLRMAVSGSMRFDGKNFQHISYQANDQPSGNRMVVHDIVEDQDGSHWICSVEAMYYYDNHSKSTSLKAIDFLRNNKDQWSRSFFNAEKTNTGDLLIGTKSGLLIYNVERDSIEDLLRFTPHIEDEHSTSNHVRHLEMDANDPNLFWCTTRSGLFLYNHLTRDFQKFKTPHFDEERLLYFGFRYNEPLGSSLLTVVSNNFLMGFNTSTRAWKEIGAWVDQSNEGVVVYDIKPLENNYLFLSVKESGQFLVDIQNDIYYPLRFTIDGKEPKTEEFWGFLVDQNGFLWTSIRPNILLRSTKAIIKREDAKCSMDIQKIFINETELDYTRLQTNELRLDKEERFISIKYSFINPNPTEDWTTEYRLNAYDEDWKTSVNETAIYNELYPGDYTFETRIFNAKDTISYNALLISVAPYWYENRSIWISSLIGLILLISFIWFYKERQKRKEIARQKKIEDTLNELESKALKSQMNPHFIFNSLNSIKSLIQDNSDEKAIHYLTEFSKFVKNVLSFSDEKQISLEEEIKICQHYLEMEKLRFEQSFKFDVEIESGVEVEDVRVPPLILQPFLENAIWHGLLHKEGRRTLKIEVKKDGDKTICIIEDNGIGREKAKKVQSEQTKARKSFGTQLILDRLQVNQEMTKNKFDVKIIDKKDNGRASGTRVELIIDI